MSVNRKITFDNNNKGYPVRDSLCDKYNILNLFVLP